MSCESCELEKRRAYTRGYNAGLSKRWSHFKPPMPPNEIVRDMLECLMDMRNEFDTLLATTGGEWEDKYGPLIDRADAAVVEMREWLVEPDTEGASQ